MVSYAAMDPRRDLSHLLPVGSALLLETLRAFLDTPILCAPHWDVGLTDSLIGRGDNKRPCISLPFVAFPGGLRSSGAGRSSRGHRGGGGCREVNRYDLAGGTDGLSPVRS